MNLYLCLNFFGTKRLCIYTQLCTNTFPDPQSTISSIVSSGASEDSSHTGATDDRGRLLTSISSFNKIGLKKTDTQDRSVPNI